MAKKWKPGIYAGLAFDEYQKIPAINNSTLSHFSRSAKHAREYMVNPPEPTDEMQLGTAMHTAVLEQERFAAEYVAAPICDRRTKAGKDLWASFEAGNASKSILPHDEMENCKKMAGEVLGHPSASALLSAKGSNEVVVVWKDKETGLLCKSRADGIRSHAGWTWLVDIKTTRDASKREFSRSIYKFGYHRQFSMYLDGLSAIKPSDYRRPVFICVENTAPFNVAVYELDVSAIEVGQAEYREYLRQYKNCVDSGVWPGYGDGIDVISLPHWAMKGDQSV